MYSIIFFILNRFAQSHFHQIQIIELSGRINDKDHIQSLKSVFEQRQCFYFPEHVCSVILTYCQCKMSCQLKKNSLPSLRAVKPIFNDLEQSAMYNALLLHLLCDVLMMKLGIMTLNGVLLEKKKRGMELETRDGFWEDDAREG